MRLKFSILSLVVLLVMASAGVVSAQTTYTYSSCSQLGLQDGGSATNKCGVDIPCFFSTVAPYDNHLCCRSGAASARCYDRKTGQFANPDYLQPPAQATDATGTGTTTDFLKSQKTSPLAFIPQITIPGSKFIAGQSITLTGATLGEYIAALYVFVVSAIGILAAVLVFYGGLKWLTAGGDRGRVQDAKEQISSALVGILLVFGAYLLLLTISPKLVRFSSLEIKPVPKRGEVEVAAEFGRVPAGTIALSGLDQAWYTKVKTNYGSFISAALQLYPGVEEKLVYAIIFVESSGNPNASSGLACGLMQLKPSTAGYADCEPLFDPKTNIYAGVSYLASLIQNPCASGSSCNTAATKCPGTNHKQDYTYVLAAYNGGTGANCYSSEGCKDGRTKWECSLNETPEHNYQATRDYVVNVPAALVKIRTFLPLP